MRQVQAPPPADLQQQHQATAPHHICYCSILVPLLLPATAAVFQ
jgi:hypothetical protein